MKKILFGLITIFSYCSCNFENKETSAKGFISKDEMLFAAVDKSRDTLIKGHIKDGFYNGLFKYYLKDTVIDIDWEKIKIDSLELNLPKDWTAQKNPLGNYDFGGKIKNSNAQLIVAFEQASQLDTMENIKRYFENLLHINDYKIVVSKDFYNSGLNFKMVGFRFRYKDSLVDVLHTQMYKGNSVLQCSYVYPQKGKFDLNFRVFLGIYYSLKFNNKFLFERNKEFEYFRF